MGIFDTPDGPFANPGRYGIRNPDKPQNPGGHPVYPQAHPEDPGLGHGHSNDRDPRPDRMPVSDFLGNRALPKEIIPNKPRW